MITYLPFAFLYVTRRLTRIFQTAARRLLGSFWKLISNGLAVTFSASIEITPASIPGGVIAHGDLGIRRHIVANRFDLVLRRNRQRRTLRQGRLQLGPDRKKASTCEHQPQN